jgi:hypothetical protein
VATSIIVPGLGDVIKELVKKGAWGILTALAGPFGGEAGGHDRQCEARREQRVVFDERRVDFMAAAHGTAGAELPA